MSMPFENPLLPLKIPEMFLCLSLHKRSMGIIRVNLENRVIIGDSIFILPQFKPCFCPLNIAHGKIGC